ncbi:MAG: HD domain-containing protein [Clostridia bacterium]|nr:HD domain-containing protein [Clostridia bacterium]MDD4047669.1 HD domain-containing protein [Clostridia bacterium]
MELSNISKEVIEKLRREMGKDSYIYNHSARVADIVCDIAEKFGLNKEEIATVQIAALVCDYGMIPILDTVNKNGKLTDIEWKLVQGHTKTGSDILSQNPHLREVAKIVLHHHERWDGNGYPNRIRENEIPLGARIIAVADSIDAMRSKRPYREPLPWKTCIKEVFGNSGVMYDPKVVKATRSLWRGWKNKHELNQGDNPPKEQQKKRKEVER